MQQLLPCANLLLCVLHCGNILPTEDGHKNVLEIIKFWLVVCFFFSYGRQCYIKAKDCISLSISVGDVTNHLPPLSVGRVCVALFKSNI